MAKHIQNIAAFGQISRKRVIRALVKEQASLLTTHHISHICRTVHRCFNRASRGRSAHNDGFFFQTLKRARTASAVHDNSRDARDFHQRINKCLNQHISPSSVWLHNSHIAKPVHDDTRKAISLGMYKAVKRIRVHQGAML